MCHSSCDSLLLCELDGGARELVVADHLVERLDHHGAVVRVHPVGVLVLDRREPHGTDEVVELLHGGHELRAVYADVLLRR